MCQSSVYLLKDGKEEEIMRDVILVEPCPEGVKVQGLFEPPRIISAKISKIDLLKHKVILESSGQRSQKI
ncbi:MAG: CooT family nickel-binding protein [Dissulfurimicrobium sp.]|uniref:CooT family nickel-binding protein n=1 Tax=Dissulfurimicrobium TaxID=1769732 RepID=UPI001EDA6C2A|nr:CooT family nickel-binding protein [Dissulfurimicrobium hydrothermale]UKL14479.1 CooT family nickel-binding protein [Dissulfurimicrobium hydrothermale]